MKSGGRTLVNGTAYQIANVKTLVNGTSYTIPFSKAPEYVLLDSGTLSNSVIQRAAYIPADTVAIIGEGRYTKSGSGAQWAFGGIMPLYNGNWLRPYGGTFPRSNIIDFNQTGQMVTFNIPTVAGSTFGPYYIYAVVSKKATWHSINVYVSKSGGTIYSTIPDNFICVIGNVSTLVGSEGVWGGNNGSYSAFWFPDHLYSTSNSFRTEVGTRLSVTAYTGFKWTDAAGITMPGDGYGAYTFNCLSLYVD